MKIFLKTTVLFLGVVFFLSTTGCSKKAAPAGAGTFPNISTVGAKVVPAIPAASSLAMVSPEMAVFPTATPITKPTSYDVSSTDWGKNSANVAEFLSPTGGVYSDVFVQLASVQSTVAAINSTNYDPSGTLTGCTKTLSSTDTVVIPTAFFAGTAIFWPATTTLTDAGMYQCYVSNTNGGYFFGKQAISGGCGSSDPGTDANKYYILNVNSTPETGDTSGYFGQSSVQRVYYNGCTTEVAIATSGSEQKSAAACAAYTADPNGDCEFSMRFELDGIASTGVSQFRIAKIDTNGASSGVGTQANSGTVTPAYPLTLEQVQAAGAASGSGVLVFGFYPASYSDATTISSTSPHSQVQGAFCLSSASGTFTLDTNASTDCAGSSTETSYVGIGNAFQPTDVMRSYMTLTGTAVFGL